MDRKQQHHSLSSAGDELLASRRSSPSAQDGTPHRLEVVGTVADTTFINDPRSTFLDASLGSLDQMPGKVVWILGDLPAEMDEGHVRDLLIEKVGAMVLFGHHPDDLDPCLKVPVCDVRATEDIQAAVFLANELAPRGGLVLFSPACPSGRGFADHGERGAEFRRAVRYLQHMMP